MLLKFLVKPCQRLSSQKSLKSTIAQIQAKLEVLSLPFQKDQENKFQFYSTAQKKLVSFTIDPTQEFIQLYNSLTEKHSPPKESLFELYHRVRWSCFMSDPVRYEKLLSIRLLAISILCNNF